MEQNENNSTFEQEQQPQQEPQWKLPPERTKRPKRPMRIKGTMPEYQVRANGLHKNRILYPFYIVSVVHIPHEDHPLGQLEVTFYSNFGEQIYRYRAYKNKQGLFLKWGKDSPLYEGEQGPVRLKGVPPHMKGYLREWAKPFGTEID